ncbi:MAG TPA: sodium-transporting two-sector ATPase [Candidatus Saccharimonadales bacterium]
MSEKHFHYLVEKGAPVGEVTSVDRYLVNTSGLSGVYPNSLVMFADGSKGIVREIADEHVSIMHLGSSELKVGTAVALQHQDLVSKVGREFIGRVINVMGEPLDGKGPIAPDEVWPVFSPAPPLIGRKQLTQQLNTGVSVIDLLFPLVYGQRLAVIGEAKSGKSTLTTQMALNQKTNNVVVVYVLIAKRRTDVDYLLTKLEENDAMKNTIVIVSTMFDSLIASYIAPYVACAMGEYLWQKKDQDVMVIYDDLTNHAHIYREISLLSGVSPGRESYPGDMFYAHSSLLERAGRLSSNEKTFTTLPIVHVPGGDITTYLPTNIMSITDGQYIMDMDLFRDGIRPAVSTGMSVSRVGGVGHNDRQKSIGQRVFKQLASYNQAAEFSHFGSELALEAKKDLEMGRLLREAFTQAPGESYLPMAQQLIFENILSLPEGAVLDVAKMKGLANEYAAKVKDDKDDKAFETARQELLKASLIELKGVEPAEPAPSQPPDTAAPAKTERDDKASDTSPPPPAPGETTVPQPPAEEAKPNDKSEDKPPEPPDKKPEGEKP